MVTAHFRPLNELLQWLQCLSFESSIDGLVATMQNLRTLNPQQMRKAAQDYRYEVEESKMTEECIQYLAQLQMDVERSRVLHDVEEAERFREKKLSSSSSCSSIDSLQSSSSGSAHSSKSSRTSDPRSLVERHIDDVFGSQDCNWNAYAPTGRPECFTEFLDSRATVCGSCFQWYQE